jgi:hypothetical protein
MLTVHTQMAGRGVLVARVNTEREMSFAFVFVPGLVFL